MICKLCKQDLPLTNFTSTQAKYCLPCKRIRQLEQRNAMIGRSLERQLNKKPKTVTKTPISQLKKMAQILVNRFCRERDIKAGLRCISCQKNAIEHGGHYWAMGSNSALRFNEWNINGQCVPCNKWQHGNPLNYRINLVKKIGENKVRWLDTCHADIKKWTREELIEIIEHYRSIIK